MSSVSSASGPGQFQVAVAKLLLDSIEQQGKDALALIESSEPPAGAAPRAPANAAAGVGTHVNYTA